MVEFTGQVFILDPKVPAVVVGAPRDGEISLRGFGESAGLGSCLHRRSTHPSCRQWHGGARRSTHKVAAKISGPALTEISIETGSRPSRAWTVGPHGRDGLRLGRHDGQATAPRSCKRRADFRVRSPISPSRRRAHGGAHRHNKLDFGAALVNLPMAYWSNSPRADQAAWEAASSVSTA